MATITYTKSDQHYYLPHSKRLIKGKVEIIIIISILYTPKTVPHQFGSSWWLLAESNDDNDDSDYMMEDDDNNNYHSSSPPAKRIKLGK